MNQPANSAAERAVSGSGIDADDLRWARTEQAKTHKRLVELLEERSGCEPGEFVRRLSASLRIPALDLQQLLACTAAFDVVSYADAARRACLALRDAEGELLLVLADPYDADLHDWAEESIRASFAFRIAHLLDIQAYLARQEEGMRAIDAALPGAGGSSASSRAIETISLEAIGETQSTVVKLVSSTLYDALKAGASDIHLETGPGGLAIKYRIDGVLSTAGTFQGVELAQQVISRIKIVSELDIAERRVPQDGRFQVSSKGREIDLRVSIMPSSFGEDAVLRILDKRALADEAKGLNLDSLGFSEGIIAKLRRLAAEPYGMLLVTGPTGSGKTTTLYAVISEVNRGIDKIITIEDPVEYQLPGVLQIPVNEKKGLTFARGLRSILRHDPDKIMVGEIRDPETAEIAVQSALTGHLVYTTVHANNVFDVIGRFTHMGVDTYNFVSALNGVMAQRLVRVNCPQCAAADAPESRLLADSQVGDPAGFRFMRGRGCAHCRGTGFRGRKAIGELLPMSDEMRELIVARAPLRRMKDAALSGGTRFLRSAALDLVRAGETTLEEINRVTFVA